VAYVIDVQDYGVENLTVWSPELNRVSLSRQRAWPHGTEYDHSSAALDLENLVDFGKKNHETEL
jgi:hypothetical protein